MRKIVILIVFTHILSLLSAQDMNYSMPLKIPFSLTGSFGEIRTNHLHAGIDLRTNGAIGLPILTIDDGFVSRIAVSATGYGNVLYIDHPNGITSVYAHLDRFSSSIDKWVREQQYKNQTFNINLEPKPEQFVFKKGETIAFSGNSGSSSGPHLHFEIRHTHNQNPLNPFNYGFSTKDSKSPVAENLYIYPMNNESHISKSNTKQRYPLVFFDGAYRIKAQAVSLSAWGELGFGVDALDYFDASWSKCGIYKLELWVDSTLFHSFTIDELSYDFTRHANSHIDYEEQVKFKRKVHKTFTEPGNRLPIYKESLNNGIFSFSDGKKHEVKIILYDHNGNKSTVAFSLVSSDKIKFPEKECIQNFKFNEANKFEKEDFVIEIPESTLFSDFCFEYKSISGNNKIFSSIHKVHNPYTPLAKPVTIKIKPKSLPPKLQKKALIAFVNGNSFTSLGGEYSEGWVTTTTRAFGDMCIVADTTPPTIVPLSIVENKMLSEKGRIRFKISDNLSGIKSYNGYIDDSWVLFEHDAKSNTITYRFDNKIKTGKNHQLKLIVSDLKDNIKEYNATFFY
jgi:hypothetical protein